ncbi:MAG TPA: FAD-dependent oxidoreductase [Solirubrobacter sp.]|jgi:glycine/D-amino acid oxidase-like deaminating enzyme|nr:FAD-dependent oxidoreductase [Solirubrobacter sp.]
MDVVVVGAGICGLATAFELRQRGLRVEVVEAEGVGAGQSAGEARIFRIAHREPWLCALALEARARWREWERALGLELLGTEGLVVVGGEAQAEAMREVGAPLELLGRSEIEARLPPLRAGHPWVAGIWDPLAGVTRVQRTLEALAARVTVRRERVESLEAIEADAIVVCAGLDTPRLVEPLGLDLQLTVEPHVRVIYEASGDACVIAPELYGLPIGSRYGIGMHAPGDEPTMFEPLTPISEMECVSLFAPWLDGGDGFIALQHGNVFVLGASNAMKFGPLIGDRLARSVIEGAVHPDLAPGRVSAWTTSR